MAASYSSHDGHTGNNNNNSSHGHGNVNNATTGSTASFHSHLSQSAMAIGTREGIMIPKHNNSSNHNHNHNHSHHHHPHRQTSSSSISANVTPSNPTTLPSHSISHQPQVSISNSYPFNPSHPEASSSSSLPYNNNQSISINNNNQPGAGLTSPLSPERSSYTSLNDRSPFSAFGPSTGNRELERENSIGTNSIHHHNSNSMISANSMNGAVGPGGASQMLIASVVQRLVNRLPCNSGSKLTTLEEEELARSCVANLVALSRHQLAVVVKELLYALESLNKNSGMLSEEQVSISVLQSQLFMLKVLVACLVHHWRCTSHDNNPELDPALPHRSSPEVIPRSWDDPPPMDDTLAKHVLGVVTQSLRQSVAREDIALANASGTGESSSSAKADGGFSGRSAPSDRSIRDLQRNPTDATSKSYGKSREDDSSTQKGDGANEGDGLSLAALSLSNGTSLFVLYPTFPPTWSPFELEPKNDSPLEPKDSIPRFDEHQWKSPSGNMKENEATDTLHGLVTSIYRHASQVIFYVSSSNWAVVYARIRNRLSYLSSTSEEFPNTSELRLIECSNLQRARLGSIIQELCTSFLHLKRTAQQNVSFVLRRTIWSWIQYHPDEFSNLFRSTRKLEGGPDVLFDHVHSLTESTKKKLIFWPMMTSLLILCPDIVGKAAIGDGRKSNSVAKKLNFLETLRKSFKNSKLSDIAVLCCVDICKAATYTPPSESGLRLLVPDIEGDLKEKLFDPNKSNLNVSKNVEISLMIDLFVALFRLDPKKTLRDLIPVCVSESSPIAFKVVLVKACVLLSSEKDRLPWNVDVSMIYPSISKLLRNTFKDLVLRSLSSNRADGANLPLKSDRRPLIRGVGKSSNSSGPEDALGRQELLSAILQLWCYDLSSASYGLSFEQGVALPSLAGDAGLADQAAMVKAALETDSVLALVYSLGQVLNVPGDGSLRNASLDVLKAVFDLKSQDSHVATFMRHALNATVSITSLQIRMVSEKIINVETTALQNHWLGMLTRFQRRKISYLTATGTTDSLPFAPTLAEKQAEIVAVEVALLLIICSSNTEVCAAAMQCCGLHSTIRTVISPGVFEPSAEWTEFFAELADPTFVQTGRIAQQKRIRALLRMIQFPSSPGLIAWKEAYHRWSSLTQIVARPLSDDNPERDTSGEKAAQWHNFSGFLAAFGGACAIDDPALLPQPLETTLLSPQYADFSAPLPMVESFMQEMVDLLVSDSVWVREKVKETLGLDLCPRLNGILFRQIHAVLSDFFNKETGLPNAVEVFTIFVEQSIGVVQMVLNRMEEMAEATANVDVGSLMVLYVEYVNSLGKGEQALRIKTTLCQLCESFMKRKSSFAFTNELRVRNRLFQALVTWTSDSTEDFQDEKLGRLQRELDVICLRTISILLDRLPLLLADDALLLDDKVEWAKSRQFSLYFNYFIKTLNRTRLLEESAERSLNDASKALASKQSLKDLGPLKESAIRALSNLLASNIDSGLQHSLPLAYHEDARIRTAFMQIMTNVLNQGAAFDDLERLSASQKQSKLVELICESDMQLALSICQVCRGYDVDAMDYILLSIFDSRGGIIKLLKAALAEEIGRTQSEEMVFRSNSFRTHLLSVFGRTHGYEYLRSIIAPLITEMASKPRGYSFEIDPTKLDPSENVHVNQARLEEMAQAFIEQICSSAHRVPAVLRELCRHIRTLMDSRFPNSRYQGVGGFMFLRFISPAIVAPQIIDINLTGPGKELRRGLLLISKILQTLASNNLFPAHKEPFMTSLNDLLKNNVWKVTSFLDQVSDARTDPDRLHAADQPLGYGIHPYGYGIDETDQRALHKFLYENVDKVGKDLMTRTPTTPRSPVADSFSSPGGNVIPNGDPKRTYESLCHILAETGEVPPEQTPAFALSGGSDVDGKQAYAEFRRRNNGRNVDDEKYRKIFWEGPPSKAGRVVYYYMARNQHAETIDFEALILHCLDCLETCRRREFDVVLDLTGICPEHLAPKQWLLYFSSMIPPEIIANLRNIININPNTTVKLYARGWFPANRHMSPGPRQEALTSKTAQLSIAYCNSIPELEAYIERRNMALDPYTVSLMTAPSELRFSQITMVWYYRSLTPVSFRIGGDHLQITALKPEEIMPNRMAYTNEVFHLSEIDDVRAISIRGDDNTFFVTCRGGTISYLFNSRDRTDIVQALRQAKARVSRFRTTKTLERQLLPSDVPGTLLNMAMLNITSENYELRLSAYELLCALSTSFNFGASNARKRLLAARGLALPANTMSFVSELSRDFAVAAPGVTLEFLLSFFEGFERAKLSQKTMCLHYMAPWLSNLVMFTHTSREQQGEYQKRIKEILSHLINVTTKQADLYAIMQRGVWAQISKLDDLIPIFIEVFSEAAMDSGLHTPRFEAILDTMVSFASINLRGKLLSRLRRVIAKTAQNPTVAHLHENAAWKEIATLVRMNMMLSFTNRLEVLLYLPELLHVILLLAGNGINATRHSIHGTAVNLMHSLCTEDPREGKKEPSAVLSPDPGASGSKAVATNGNGVVSATTTEDGLDRLRALLARFADEDICSLFGLPPGQGNAFSASSDVVRESPDIASIEKLASIMYEIAEMAAPTIDTANSWRARLTSLVTSTAFQYNPIIQSRAFVLLGCLAQGEIDDDLLYQILVSLRGSISEWASLGNDAPMISIVTCLGKVVKILPDRSRYLPQMFWLGISMVQYGHIPLFKAGVDLLHSIVSTIWSRNLPAEEGTADIIAFLLDARYEFREAACRLDDEMGVDFEINFSFGVAALLVKGLRHPSTKECTTAFLQDMLRFSSIDADGTIRSEDGRISSSQLGFFVGLLPTATRPEDFGELLRMAGASEEVCEKAVLERKQGQNSLYQHLNAPGNKIALLVVTLAASLLQHAESDAERLLLYRFLADSAIEAPAIVSILYESLAPGMREVFVNSQSGQILDAVQTIAHIGVSEPVFAAQLVETAKRGGPIAFLEESGYASLLDCGSFTPLGEDKRMRLAKLSTALLGGLIDAGTA